MKSLLQRYTFPLTIMGIIVAIVILLQVNGVWAELWEYEEDIVYLFWQHMGLVAISGGLAILVAVPLGIILSRSRFANSAETVMQVLNIGTTIPTLAILALSMSVLGIGTLPAIVGLFISSLLPIVRNTYTGLKDIPAYMKEAARGIGMSELQMLFKVEIPNALFVMFAGIRVALAINVGTASLAFLIGGGGLGELIFTGIDVDIPMMTLAGALPTALSAVLIDFCLGILMFFIIPKGVNPLRN